VRSIGNSFDDSRGHVFVSGTTQDIHVQKRTEYLLRKVVDSNPHFVFIKNEDGTFEFVNLALAAFYGLDDPRGAIGLTDEWFYQGDDRLQVKAQLQGFANGDRAALASHTNVQPPIPIYERIIPPHGSIADSRWFATIKSRIDVDGKPCVLGISTDVTGLAYQVETLEELMRHSPAVMYCKDARGRYTRVNRAFLDAVGANTFSDALGMTAGAFFSTETFADIMLIDQEVLSGSAKINHKHVIRFRDGRTKVFRGSKMRTVSVDSSGHIHPEVIGVYFDITNEERSSRFAMFESVVKCIDHDYVQCFLQDISSKMSSSEAWASLEKERRLWTQMMSMATGFLARLRWLDKAVRPAKAAPYGDVFSFLETVAMIERMCGTAGYVRPGIRISVETGGARDDVMVRCEREILFSVLYNFISNAKKYTDIEMDAGVNDLDVVVRVRECEGGGLTFLVDDAGCGLKPEFLENATPLFEQGVRSVPRGSAIPGGGNGLFFTKMLVEDVLKGQLVRPITSERGGAVFGFSLPENYCVRGGAP